MSSDSTALRASTPSRGCNVDFSRPTRAPRPARRAPPPDYSNLHAYQVPAVDWMRGRDRGLLADAMGLGKTAEALRGMTSRRNIVVCPASALGVWEVQGARWRDDLSIDASNDGNLRAPQEGEIVLCSWDMLPDPMRVRGARLARLILEPTDDVDVYFDEIQYAKTHGTLRQQRACLLAAQCRRAFGLSGTPMDTPEHMWVILATLDLATKLFPGGEDEFVGLCGGKPRWVMRNGRRERVGYEWGTVSEEVRKRVASVTLRRTARDPEVALSLPKVVETDVWVKPPKDVRDLLDAEERALRPAWEKVGPDDMPPIELFSTARRLLAEHRIPAMLDWVRASCTEYPVVVFCSHVKPLQALLGKKAKLPKGYTAEVLQGSVPNRERTAMVERFQTGQTRVLGVSTAGAEAITLTAAGAMLLVDRPWLYTVTQQIKARIVRQGSEHGSAILATMRTTHPLDERLQEVLDEKQRTTEEMGMGGGL